MSDDVHVVSRKAYLISDENMAGKNREKYDIIQPMMGVEKLSDSSKPPNVWNRQEKRLWIGTMFVGCMAVYACRTVTPLCMVSISKEMNWSKTETGTVLSSFFWGYAMTQILGGYVSDRIGGEKVLMSAAAGWALITFWTPQIIHLVDNKSVAFAVIVLSRILMGCFQGVHYPSMTSFLARKVTEDERAFSFATAAAGSQFGTLITGSLGSYLMDRVGWRWPFHVLGTIGIMWLLFLRYYAVAKDRRKTRVISVHEHVTNKDMPHNDSNSVPWMTLFKKPAFWALLLGHFCKSSAYFLLLSWMPMYFGETFPNEKGWVFNVVPWIVAIPMSIGSGWLADKMIANGYSTTYVRKLMATVTLAGSGTCLLLISYTSSYEAALFFMAMALACAAFHGAGILVNPQDIAPKYAGSVFGMMNTAGAIQGFVGVYIAGYILDVTGSWAAVFTETAVVCFTGWIIFMVFGTGKQLV